VRHLVVAGALAAAVLALGAAPAGATSECRGLQVCVPIQGPWVVVPTGRAAPRPSVDYRLSCPRGYVVGGLDAELSARGLDLEFRATLGSPVNPGISTSQAAVFLGSLVAGSARAPSFRPHIGCIPAAGGGVRVPTSVRTYPVGRPTILRAKDVPLRPGGARVVQACKVGETLVGGWHALAFYTRQPPSHTLVRAVTATRTITAGSVAVDVSAGRRLAGVRAVVQVGAVCAGGQ
jgi:hypothetical protein